MHSVLHCQHIHWTASLKQRNNIQYKVGRRYRIGTGSTNIDKQYRMITGLNKGYMCGTMCWMCCALRCFEMIQYDGTDGAATWNIDGSQWVCMWMRVSIPKLE